MRPYLITHKQVSCLLLLVMYAGFLCFQVKYNLHVAQQIASIAEQRNTEYSISIHAAIQELQSVTFSKTKVKPTKRFYPKTALPVATAVCIELSTVAFGYTNPYYHFFFSSSPRTEHLQRGPPAVLS